MASVGFFPCTTQWPSTIDWCETNFTLTPSVAEFWNTISSLFISAVGALGIFYASDLAFLTLSIVLIITGLGSALFHGTLCYPWQIADEVPMMWLALLWLYVLLTLEEAAPGTDKGKGKGKEKGSQHPLLWRALHVVMFVYCAFVCVLHAWAGFVLTFQAHFIGLLLLGVALMVRLTFRQPFSSYPVLKQLLVRFFVVTFAACMVWLMDYHGCALVSRLPWGLPNPQLHSWWHVGMGCAALYSGTFLECARFVHRNREEPRLWWLFGVLPLVDHLPGGKRKN